MNNPNTLDDFYRYWDKFYEAWRHNDMNTIKCLGWSEPDFIGSTSKPPKKKNVQDKIAVKTNDIITHEFLPEPWWGYSDCTESLHSVVVNFNPGKGGKDQFRNQFIKYNSYRRFISDRVLNYLTEPTITKNWLWATSNWHYKNRAKCLFDITPDIPWNEKFLNNHLSIELIPWHSPNFNQDVVGYAKKNLSSIIKYSIAFAVEASKIIKNEVLQNVVIFRCSLNRLKSIFDGSSDYEIIEGYNQQNCFENARCVFFKIRDKKSNMILFQKNKLVAIWQPYHTSMNNFPYSADMKRIFEI